MRLMTLPLIACWAAALPPSPAQAGEFLGNVDCDCGGSRISNRNQHHPDGHPMSKAECQAYANQVVAKNMARGRPCCKAWCTEAGSAEGDSKSTTTDLGSTAQLLEDVANMSAASRAALVKAGDRAAALVDERGTSGSPAGSAELKAKLRAMERLAPIGEAMDTDQERTLAAATELDRQVAAAMDEADWDRPVADLKSGTWEQGAFAFGKPDVPEIGVRKVVGLSERLKAFDEACATKFDVYTGLIIDAVGGVEGVKEKAREKLVEKLEEIRDDYIEEHTKRTTVGRVRKFKEKLVGITDKAIEGFEKNVTNAVTALGTNNYELGSQTVRDTDMTVYEGLKDSADAYGEMSGGDDEDEEEPESGEEE